MAFYWIDGDSSVYIGYDRVDQTTVNWGCQYYKKERDFYVISLFVPKHMCGRGVGRAYVHTSYALAVLLGANRLVVNVSGQGWTFWPHMGFQQTGSSSEFTLVLDGVMESVLC